METLAGFLLSRLGHIPVQGEEITEEGRVFRVEEMSGHRISRVRVQSLAKTDAEDLSATEDDGLEIPA